MSTPRFQAWQFLYPGLDAADPEAGLAISPTGGIATVSDRAAIRQAILLLLSTRPGERVMRPTYGCDLSRLVFQPNDATTAGLAVHYVRQALLRFEPRVEIVSLDAEEDPGDPGRLLIRLDYRRKATRELERLTYTVHLTGEPL
jgi:phage baseplate assembly protein W